MISLQDMAWNAVRSNYCSRDDKIGIIKTVRACSGCGLREVKDAVEAALDELRRVTEWTAKEVEGLKLAAGYTADGREFDALETLRGLNNQRRLRHEANAMWPFVKCE